MADNDLGPHGLEPAKAIGKLIIDTLKKLENDRTVLVRVDGHTGVLLTTNRTGVFAVEKVAGKRIVHMVARGWLLEKRHSAFDQMNWLEYDLTYEGVMVIRENT